MENNPDNKNINKPKKGFKKIKKKHKKKKKDNTIFFFLIFILIFIITCVGIGFIFISHNKERQEKQVATKATNVKNEVIDFAGYTKYKFKYTYSLNVSGKVDYLEFVLPIPKKENDRQYLTGLKINIKPLKIYKENGTTFAKFVYEDIVNQKIDIELSGIANLRTYNIETAKSLKIKNTNTEDLDTYLKREPLIESDDPFIVNIANQIKGNTREEILQNMYEYIQKHMTYKIIPNDIGAKKALQTGYGKCSEHAAIMVALSRAKGIPARIAAGNIAREQNTQHAWAEIYFDEYGWVTYDPTVQATNVNIYNSDGQLVQNDKKYDTSPDVQYIKSGINIFTPFFIKYSGTGANLGKVNVNENIKIEKI